MDETLDTPTERREDAIREGGRHDAEDTEETSETGDEAANNDSDSAAEDEDEDDLAAAEAMFAEGTLDD
eukprot:m.28457 g.28457  ORF g.28457 m.28457 type:complete len:69 (-) comp11841_c0_seq1:46-252(-)